MLSLVDIRENQGKIIQGLKKRKFSKIELINQLKDIDRDRRRIKAKLDNHLSEGNRLAKEIGFLFKSGDNERANLLKEKTSTIKINSKELNKKLEKIEHQLINLRIQIPNVPDEDVPIGDSYKYNEEVFKSGKIPNLSKTALSHWELSTKYNLIDFDAGSKITGAGFPIYKGNGAKLQRALIQFFLDRNISAGYEEYQVPLIVNKESAFGTGQLPDKDGQMYHIQDENFYLIPTSEVPLTNIFRGQIINSKDLPICITGYTPCFRREAGSYGSNVRGLNRLHQFDKVEIVRIENPECSYDALDKMLNHVKKLLHSLELPYRILNLCGGDLGFTSAITYDFEIFSSAQNKWLEVSSVSNFETFQSIRLKLKYKDINGKNQFAHTLNGSSLALPRVMAGILENNQTNDSIKIPKVLIPYTDFKLIS